MEKYAENLRKMFVSMAQDIRIVMIKMADRLDNLRTLDALPKEKQKRIAQESLEIYAPIASRLGMGFIKGEIEDLSFPYVYPDKYKWLNEKILPKIELKLEYVQKVIKVVGKKLKDDKINTIDIHGRKKRLYSLYFKLQKPHYKDDPDKIFDLVALRIIVPTVADCYQTLGVIHKLWKPISGRIKDFIAQPKPNGYQSLHTTVFCVDGKIVEFQIRTPEMHQQAEHGIAAHWHYKEASSKTKKIAAEGQALPKKFEWIEDLVSWQKDIADNKQYLDSLSIDFFKHRFFVFTPKHQVIVLPENSSPLDFAYAIHSDLGNKCGKAKVNEKLVPLSQKLDNADIVEIFKSKEPQVKRQWLSIAKSKKAQGFLLGQVMQKTKGQANPRVVSEILARELH